MKNLILFLIFMNVFSVYGQVKKINDKQLNLEIYKVFNDRTRPQFYLNTGSEIDDLEKYLTSPNGFSINYYKSRKDKIRQGSNFIVSLIKEQFLDYIDKFEDDFKEILQDNYDIVLERIKKNETFYILDKGEKVNKLILCGKNKDDISSLLKSLFMIHFPTDASDLDMDGLPDYYEKKLGTKIDKNDTDNDGLSDYDEHFKYLTNPLEKDSDGDGLYDNNWHERREYTYTIYVKREVYAPFDTSYMDDFYQDIRNVKVSGDTLRFEALLFPEANNIVIPNSQLTGNSHDKIPTRYISPSYFCNYTIDMEKELNDIIKEWDWGNDYELAYMFSNYCIDFSTSYPANGPIHFYIEVENNEVKVVHEEKLNKIKTPYYPSLDRILDNQVFGRGMYKNRMHGTCGSSSVFYNTLFRAINFPTRIICSNPIINYSDTSQIKLLENIKHEGYREIALSQKRKLGGRYANHFFYEIYINGRWIRCDYDKVNIGCTNVQGLFTLQDKFVDFSEKNFAETWGIRMVEDLGNAYKTIELSDKFPIHEQ